MRSTTHRVVHGSTDAASTRLGAFRSHMSSPCSHGVSRRQNVQRRVFVAVVVCVALWAVPLAHGQRQRFEDVSASVAAFAGWEESVYPLERLPVPFAFVLEHLSNGAKGSVREASGQAVIADHASDVEVFNTDHIEVTHECCREFVQVICPGISDACVKLGDSQASTCSSLATLGPSCQDSLGPGELLLQSFAMPHVWDSGPVREGREATDAKIDTDGFPSFRQLLDLLIKNKGYEVSTRTVLGYRGRGRRACECSGPADLEPAELGKSQIAVLSIPLEGGPGVLGSLFAVFLLEAGVSSPFFEEVLKGCLKVAKGLLGRHARDISEPGMIVSLLQSGQCSRRSMIANGFAIAVTVGSQAQSPVVDISATSENLVKQNLLLGCGITAEPVPELHMIRIARVNSFIKLSWRRRFHPGLKAGVSTPKKTDDHRARQHHRPADP